MSGNTKVKNIPTPLLSEELDIKSIWKVLLFNCYCHSYDEVVDRIMIAIGCDYITAQNLADSAEKFGNVTVYEGTFSECTKVANVLGSTGMDVRVG